MKILVVDDIESNVYQLQVLLGSNGYAVETAANGAIALEKARRQLPDLIITDILMPVMDGFSLCREWMLDERLKHVPLVFYTATYTDERDRKLALDLGATRFIIKPEEPDVFLRTIEKVVANREHGQLIPQHPIEDEVVYLKEYSEALVRKLEDRNRDLEQTNRQLGRELAERKLAEQQLREQNEILSNAHEAVVIVSLAGQVTFWNRAAEELFGWSSVDALGRSPEQLLGFEEPAAMAAIRAAVENQGSWRGELRSTARDGRRLVVEGRITLVRDEAGQPRARLGFFSDITEKKLLEEKFLHAQRLESIGMLAAGIAHDLNNIFAPIVFAAPLLRGSLVDPRDLNILEMMAQSAARGSALVKQILSFAQNATGELETMQVRHLVRDVISVAEQTFPKSIQVDHHIASDLWAVRGNATQIHQVVMNLCVNARDAMPHGGKLSVTARNCRLDEKEAAAIPGAQPGTWMLLEVADTGTGIPSEVLAQIWQPFFTTKGAGKGTGLGLSTVRGIVAAHCGFIDLHTEPDRGSTFRVFLPAHEADQPPQDGAAPVPGTAGQGELILVVDDDPAVCAVVAAILGRNGYRVICCGDGVEAITVFGLRGTEISLVVTDVDMPRLGGSALSQTLLRERPELRLLAISGLAREGTKALDPSITSETTHAFLLKPFGPAELLQAVDQLLHSSKTASDQPI